MPGMVYLAKWFFLVFSLFFQNYYVSTSIVFYYCVFALGLFVSALCALIATHSIQFNFSPLYYSMAHCCYCVLVSLIVACYDVCHSVSFYLSHFNGRSQCIPTHPLKFYSHSFQTIHPVRPVLCCRPHSFQLLLQLLFVAVCLTFNSTLSPFDCRS